jgi:redox-regulated HSP33 family molecular chaperone
VRRKLLFVGLPLALLLGVAAAIAFYTAAGSGSASASVGELSAPTISSATGGVGTVALSWSTVSPPTGSDTVTYYVSRDGGTAGGSCPPAASPTSVTSCTDSGLAAGTTYHYTVTAVWHSWTATSAQATATTTARTITLTASSGHVGDTVSISGQAFPASASVSATYDGSAVTVSPATSTDGAGSFSGATFVVPASPAGANTVVVTAGGQTASATFTVTPKITLSPTSGTPGSSNSISGSGFAASSSLSATFNTTSALTLTGTTATDSTGSFSGATYTAPYIGSGTYAVRVTDASSNNASANYRLKGSTTSRASAAWNVSTTWTGSTKTGTITTSTLSTTVTGSGTRFTTELQAGDAVYLGDGTTLVGTIASITSDTTLTLQANAASTNSGVAYTGGRVPTSLDDVTIAAGNAVTVPAAYAASAQSLLINAAGSSQSVALLASSSSLTVTGNVDLTQPTNGNNTQLMVDTGTATIGGNLDFNTTATNNNKCERVRITSGALTVSGALNLHNPSSTNNCNTNGGFGKPNAMTDIDMSAGGGTLNLAGAINVDNPAIVTAGLDSTATSVVDFNGTSAQTIPVPTSSQWIYGDIVDANASGATFGAASVAGDILGDVTISSGATLGTGNFNQAIAGNFTNNGTFNAGTSMFTFAGTSAETIGGSHATAFSSLTVNSTSTVTLATGGCSVAGNLTVSSGTLDLGANTLPGSGGVLSVGAGDTLAVGGTNGLPSGYPTHSLDPASTVNYEGTSQTVSNESYGSLTLSGSGTKTMPAGALSIAAAFTTSGTVSATAQATVTIGGNVTIGSGTTFATGAFADSIGGNFTNNGTFTATGSTVTLNGTGAQSIGGSSATAFANLTVSKSAGTATLAATETVGNNLTVSQGTLALSTFALSGSGGGTFSLASGTTLNVGGSANFPSSYGTTSLDPASTVVYNGAAQTVSGQTYGNLTFSGSNTKTAAAALTLAGAFTIGSGTTFAAGSFTHSFAGSFTSNGTFTAGTSTATFNGTAAQTIGGSSTTTFNTLTLNNSSGVTLAHAESATNLTVAAGSLDLSTFALTGTGSGTLTISAGASLLIAGTNGFPASFPTHTLAATSTVDYYGTNQSVSGESYGNLIVNSVGTATLAATGTIAGNLTVSSGTLDLSTFTLNRTSSGGTLTVGAGATLLIGGTNGFPANYTTHSLNATSTVNYDGTTQSVSGESYGNLTVSDSGTATLAATGTTAGNLTVSSGTLDLASFTVDRASSGGTLTVSNGATLALGGTNGFPANYATHTLGATSTVNYYGTTQSVSGESYGNLTVSGSGTATLAAAGTVAGNLTASSGTLDVSTFTLNGSGTFTLSNGATLLVGGAANFPSSYATTSLGASSTINYDAAGAQTIASPTYGNLTFSGSGTKTAAGALTIAGNTTIGSGATFAAGSFTHLLAGNFTNNGTLNAGTSTITLNGTGAQSIGGSSTSTFNNLAVSKSSGTANLAANENVGNNLSVSQGTLDASSFTLNGGGAGTFSVSNGATLLVGGASNFPTSYGTTTLGASSTVNYDAAGAQTVSAGATYGNLTTSGSGTKTAAGALTVAGNLTIGSGTTFAPSSFSHSVGGNFVDNGGFTSSGTVTFNGSGAQSVGGANATAFNNVVVNSSNTVSLATSGTVAGNLTVSAGTLDLGANTLPGGGSGTLSVSNGATLAVGGTNGLPAGYSTHTLGASSTVNYEGTSQTVSNETYGNLTTSGSGTKAAAAGLTTNGDVTVGSGTTLAAGAFSDSVAGNFTNNGAFTSSGTVTLIGTGSEAIGGSSVTSFTNLTISNSTTAVTAATNFNVSGTFTVGGGALFTPGAAVVFNSAGAAGTITGSGTVQVTRTAATPDYLSQYKFTTNSLINLTVEYSASAAQTIDAIAYGNLKLSGTGTKTAAAGLTVSGNVTIASGATFAASSFSHSFGGNFTNSGSFTSTGTVTFNGTGTQSIGGSSTTSFSSLTISNASAAVSAATNLSVSGTFTIGAGSIFTPGASVVVNSGGAAGTITGSGDAQVTSTAASGYSGQYQFTTNTLTNLTVEYSAAAGQTISAVGYGNLTTSGSGTKTAAAGLTVTGALAIGSGTTFAASSFSHTFQGNVTNNGTFSAGTSTVTLNGSGTQTLGGSSTTSFNNLVDSNSNFAPAVNFNLAGTMTVSAGVTLTPAAAIVVNSGGTQGTITGSGTVQVTRTAATADFSSQYQFTTNTLANLAVQYVASASQTISALAYGTLSTSGSGTKTAGGPFTVAGAFTIGSGTTVDSGGFAISVAGSWTNNGSFSANGGTVTLNGSGAQSIGGSSTTTFNNLTVSSGNTVSPAASQSVAGNLTVSSGTLDLTSFTLDRTSAGGTLTVSNGATLAIGGTTTFPANYSTHTLGASSTVNYAGAAQTVTNESYGNLLLSGSGTKTMPAGALSIAGTFTTSGTVSATAQAAVTVGGDMTIGSGTTFTAGAFTDSVGGNLTNNGTFTATGSTVVLNGTGSQAIGGSTATSFTNLTLSNSTTAITAATNLGVSGTFTISSGAVFTPAAAVVINGAGAVGTITGSGTGQVTSTNASGYSAQYKFTTNTLANLTVDYSSSSAQTIVAVAYGNLKTSGNATKTAAAALTVTGDVTIGSGSTFAAANFNHSFAGNFTDNGTFTSAGTVTFNGTGAQAIGGSTTTAFNSVTINKSSGAASLTGSATAAANLTVTAGTLDLSTFSFNRATAGGTLTVSNGATLRVGGASNFPINYTTVSLASGSTVEYYAASAQTITSATYGNLLLTGSATKTAGGALTVAGNLTIGSGATFAGSTFSHSIAGNWSNSGTFTAGTSTVTLNGSSGQTLTGATTFNNLTLNNAAGFTLQNNETTGGTLTLTSGVVATGANTLIVSAGGTVSRTSGYINGTEQRGFNTGAGQSATFDVGTASTYAPIGLASLGVTTGGTLTATTTSSQQPNYATSGLSQTQYVNRYWTLTPGSGLVVSGYNATDTFVAGDLVGSPPTANLALFRYSGGSWTAPTTWSATSTTATGTGFGTGFGDFAAGIPAPTQLVFTTQPAGAVPGLAFTTQPQVSVEDAMGHVVTSDTSTVTLSITSGTPTSGGPGTLSGCSQSETNGVITFSGCSISAFGGGYKLHAVDGALTVADSSAFNTSMGVTTVASKTDTANVTTDTTSTFGLQPNAVYVVHVFRHSASGDSVTGISTSGFAGASALTAIAPTAATPTTGQNWNTSVDYQYAWYFTTGASPSGTGTVTATFTKGLGAGQVTVIDVTQILGANTSSPLAQASSAATGNSTTATGNLGSAPVSTFDTKLVLLGEQANTTPSSANLANLFVSNQPPGTGATLWTTNPFVQNDNITVTNGQWGTLTLEIAHA